jgi:hypothetical protein
MTGYEQGENSHQEIAECDEVIINTETVFDEEGVPVSIRSGVRARVLETNAQWTQVVVWWYQDGVGVPEILGVPTKHIAFFSHMEGSRG